jgi:glycosyltransferase involved in cell wall biosynthesis
LFVCVSEHIRQKAVEQGFPEQKLWVHRIGVHLNGAAHVPISSREPVVLFVGRLVEKKGCIHLLRAMTVVERMLPDARLVILGDGPLRPALEAQARSTLRQCEFLGAQPVHVVRDWMQRARLLATPSVVAASGDSEGLPIVLCEAQAVGLPIVGFRGPGVSEAVRDGETAMLVKPRDEYAFANTMLSLLMDDAQAERMSQLGRQHAETHFDLHAQTQLLEEKYFEVLRRP